MDLDQYAIGTGFKEYIDGKPISRLVDCEIPQIYRKGSIPGMYPPISITLKIKVYDEEITNQPKREVLITATGLRFRCFTKSCIVSVRKRITTATYEIDLDQPYGIEGETRGRKPKPSYCRCGVLCPSARAAQEHCKNDKHQR